MTSTKPTQSQTQSFNAEIQQLLDLVIHSLYSKKEIFLRELISNASDAIDKRRFESLTHPSMVCSSEYKIELEPLASEHILKIRDNGIGMSPEEVTEFIGTIAKSGTKKFTDLHKQVQNNPELIGQFGVGFYSSFMVAQKVMIHTQKAGSSEGTLWESEGRGEYTITALPRPEGSGTTVTLFLKTEDEKKDQDHTENTMSFTDQWTLKNLVKTYSNFIQYPIFLILKDQEPEVLNTQKALWQKNPSEITEQEHLDFYRHISHDWGSPQKWWHWKVEGSTEFTSLIYLPSTKPWNFNMKDYNYGLSLYIKKVFIMDHNQELLPPYLRFMKGLVDCSDLPLNVSREILQNDRQIQVIKKNVLNKLLNGLKEMQEKQRPEYDKFFNHFGPTLKEGFLLDPSQKEKLADLVLFKSTETEKIREKTQTSLSFESSQNTQNTDNSLDTSSSWVSLSEYVARKKPNQKAIYFITGENLSRVQHSPYLEKLHEKGFEVLLLTDPVDEWVTRKFTQYQGLPLQSVIQDSLDWESEEEKQESETQWKLLQDRFATVLESLKTQIHQVKDIKLSKRLTTTPACLVLGEGDVSPHMQKLLQQMGETSTLNQKENSKRILELNPKHPLVEHLLSLKTNKEQESWIELLYYQALITEGSPVENPHHYVSLITEALLPQQQSQTH
jgi:molecular chaperone HtpG